MGFLSKLLGSKITCPLCGSPNAQDAFDHPKCTNRGCRNYDSEYAWKTNPRRSTSATASTAPAERPAPAAADLARRKSQTPASPTSVAAAGADHVVIPYVNYQSRNVTFVGDPTSARNRGLFISVCVKPKGVRIALRKTKIGDAAVLARLEQEAATRRGRRGRRNPPAPSQGPLVELVYTNHSGTRKTFQAHSGTLKQRGQFISVCVAPTGRRIALRRAQIQNPDAVRKL